MQFCAVRDDIDELRHSSSFDTVSSTKSARSRNGLRVRDVIAIILFTRGKLASTIWYQNIFPDSRIYQMIKLSGKIRFVLQIFFTMLLVSLLIHNIQTRK